MDRDSSLYEEGSIFFIPLFLPIGIKESIKSYNNFKFRKADNYAFGRLIEIDKTRGDLVEIFNYVGAIPEKANIILNSCLMFNPLHVSLGFAKNRWRFIYEDPNYDKFKDSGYKEISFVLGDDDKRILWQGGRQIPDRSKEELQGIDEWIVYPATKVEERIKNTLKKMM